MSVYGLIRYMWSAFFLFFKQKTADEMRISDWSSDVCSSDLQEMRLHQYAVKAAIAFARANHIDKVVFDSPNARLGIVTTGKSYLDVLQALEYLGLDRHACEDIGLRVRSEERRVGKE